MRDSTKINVTETELYMLASEIIQEHMDSFTNKSVFSNMCKDDIMDKLMDMVASKRLSIGFIESLACANVSNFHVALDFDNNEKWMYMGGMSKALHSRDEFLSQIEIASKSIHSGNVTIKDKTTGKQFGKDYFKNRR